jgi:hypothetical protein
VGRHVLLAALLGTSLFGLAMLLMPAATRAGFAWLMYGDPARMTQWPAEAMAYATLAHGVMGAMMLAWALSLALVVGASAKVPGAFAWRLVALSITVWYVADSSFSAAVGAWPNVALNTGFLLVLGAALWASSGLRRVVSVTPPEPAASATQPAPRDGVQS